MRLCVFRGRVRLAWSRVPPHLFSPQPPRRGTAADALKVAGVEARHRRPSSSRLGALRFSAVTVAAAAAAAAAAAQRPQVPAPRAEGVLVKRHRPRRGPRVQRRVLPQRLQPTECHLDRMVDAAGVRQLRIVAPLCPTSLGGRVGAGEFCGSPE